MRGGQLVPEALSLGRHFLGARWRACRKKRDRWKMPQAWKMQPYLEDSVISPIIK